MFSFGLTLCIVERFVIFNPRGLDLPVFLDSGEDRIDAPGVTGRCRNDGERRKGSNARKNGAAGCFACHDCTAVLPPRARISFSSEAQASSRVSLSGSIRSAVRNLILMPSIVWVCVAKIRLPIFQTSSASLLAFASATSTPHLRSNRQHLAECLM